MKSGLNSAKDWIEVFAWCLGAISVSIAALAYYLSRNQFRFVVMTNCVDRFQKIMAQLRYGKDQEKDIALKQYIDLCNEELFYFQNKFLPKEVIDEWLEGMINFLPCFNETGEVISPPSYSEIIEQNLLLDYPRIKRVFTLTRKYDFADENEKKKLILELGRNIRPKIRLKIPGKTRLKRWRWRILSRGGRPVEPK